MQAKAEAASAVADRSSHEALIAHLKLEIEKLRRQLYGQRAERKERLLDQLELQLESWSVGHGRRLAAEAAAKPTQTVRSFTRRRAGAQALPGEYRTRADCPCRPEAAVLRIGQLVEAWRDVTETLEICRGAGS